MFSYSPVNIKVRVSLSESIEVELDEIISMVKQELKLRRKKIENWTLFANIQKWPC